MKRIYLILLIPIFISCTNKISESNSEQRIDTLKYSYNGFNNGGSLYLLSNGKFEHRKYVFGCTGGGEDKRIYGDYKIENSILYLSDKNIKLEILPFDFNGESETLLLDIIPDSLKLNNEFQIVKWNNNEYLLSEKFNFGWSLEKENDYIRFSERYNSGSEPENSGMYLKKEGVNNISKIEKMDLNQIPIKWRNMFLTEPISTKIVSSIKQNGLFEAGDLNYWIVEIDKGSEDFVRKGMSFTTEDGDTFFHIDSISTNKSYSKVFEYDISNEIELKTGTIFKTNWN